MAATLIMNESEPEEWPATPAGLSAAAAALDPAVVWTRIEAYIARRWAVRDVSFVVEGPGQWSPPLFPVSVSGVDIWQDDEWKPATLAPSPVGGYVLEGEGPYRFTGTAGGTDVPASGKEAFKRLAEYLAAKQGKPGAIAESITAGSVSISVRRDLDWLAGALANSGAADLLRTYRRAAR